MGSRSPLAFAKQQCDEKTPQADIAIQKRMDCLELHVDQAGLDQRRLFGLVFVEEELKMMKELGQPLRWRWDESSVARTCAAYPVLTRSELARLLFGAAPSGEQNSVYLAYQAQR